MSDATPALSELADLMGTMGHPDRLRILLELQDSPKDVATLVQAVGLSQSRTSQHLGLLKAHHLVRAQRNGRRVFYQLTSPEITLWILQGVGFINIQQNLNSSIQALLTAYKP